MTSEIAKHTPGPWSAKGHYSCSVSGHQIIGFQIWSEGPRVALTEQQNVGRDAEQANARLIAAAPDLLAALKNVMAALGEPAVRVNFPDALAATAKAEGRA